MWVLGLRVFTYFHTVQDLGRLQDESTPSAAASPRLSGSWTPGTQEANDAVDSAVPAGGAAARRDPGEATLPVCRQRSMCRQPAAAVPTPASPTAGPAAADSAAQKHAEAGVTGGAVLSCKGHPAVLEAARQEAAGGGVPAAERPRGATSPTAAVAPLPLQWGAEKGAGGSEPRCASQLRATLSTISSAQSRGSR